VRNILYQSKVVEKLGYVGFIGLFGLEMVLCAVKGLDLTWWQVMLLGFAAYRGGRAISYNGVFHWLREPFCHVKKDSCKAGDNVEVKHAHGLMHTLGDLLCCPICTGTHVASALMSITAFWPELGQMAIYGLAAAGIGELVHWTAESAEWHGRSARVLSGKIAPDEDCNAGF